MQRRLRNRQYGYGRYTRPIASYRKIERRRWKGRRREGCQLYTKQNKERTDNQARGEEAQNLKVAPDLDLEEAQQGHRKGINAEESKK